MPRLAFVVFVFILLVGCAKTVVENEPIPFETVFQTDTSLYDFETKVISSGVEGTAEVTYKVKENRDGSIREKEEVGRKVITEPQKEVVARGIKKLNGVLVVMRSVGTKKTAWCVSHDFGFQGLSGWPNNYSRMAANSIIYNFKSDTVARATVSDMEKYIGGLTARCPLFKKEMSASGEMSFLGVFPTLNFAWGPSGKYRLLFDSSTAWSGIPRLVIQPSIIFPPEIVGPRSIVLFDLSNNVQGLVVLDDPTGIGATGKVYICRLGGDGKAEIIDSYPQLLSNVALSPDKKKIAFAYNSGIYVYDAELGGKEIEMDWALNATKVWDLATVMVGFNPDSDLVCFLWPEVTNSFDTPNPPCHFYVGSWRTGSFKMIMPEISRDPKDGNPFFWLRD